MSITTKSRENIYLSTLRRKSSTTLYRYLITLSVTYNVILVVLISKSPIFISIAKGIKFTLAPKSNKALSTNKATIVTGIVKLPGYLDFRG